MVFTFTTLVYITLIPLVQEMVEPLEETRVELTFATEPVLSSLELSIPGSKRNSGFVDLDEIEVCILKARIVNAS